MIIVETDLRPLFGSARDQGQRPTCLAFAASDAHASLRNSWIELSCEYAFYHAQSRTGRSALEGATLESVLDALRYDGQPIEKEWPYLQDAPSDPTQWLPPPSIKVLFKRAGEMSVDPISVIISQLQQQRPVILLATLSQSFFSPTSEGVIDPQHGEDPEPAMRHAFIAVGHGQMDDRPVILVRNSWGSAWGVDGYGWVTENFLAPRLFATAVLLEEIDVSTGPTTT